MFALALRPAPAQDGGGLSHRPDGIAVAAGGSVVEVEALRQDVLRVRVYPAGHAPEDASWAVLPAARTARVPVRALPDGFQTEALTVKAGADGMLTVADRAGHVLQQDAAPVRRAGTAFAVSKVRTPDDHFFGLGDKPGPLDRTGEVFTMWNTDSFGWEESTDPIYKTVPFFLEMHAGRTIGVLFDNTYRTSFDFGRTDPARSRFSAPYGPLVYSVLCGPEPKAVVELYAWLTGPTPLPPACALGYQQSRYSYLPESRVEEVAAARLRADRIPSDVIWLDIDYQDRNRPFTVDTKGFADFAGRITGLPPSTSIPW